MPITNGKYVNPGWKNGGPPALDAGELNAISNTLVNVQNASTKVSCLGYTGTVPIGPSNNQTVVRIQPNLASITSAYSWVQIVTPNVSIKQYHLKFFPSGSSDHMNISWVEVGSQPYTNGWQINLPWPINKSGDAMWFRVPWSNVNTSRRYIQLEITGVSTTGSYHKNILVKADQPIDHITLTPIGGECSVTWNATTWLYNY